MKKFVVLIVLAMAATGWSQGLPRRSLSRPKEVPRSERDCWGCCEEWRYTPKYGYIESIEKAKEGDAEAKFCFAKYCSRGKDECGAPIPRDEKKAGKLLLESADAGFGPAEYAMFGMMTISDGYIDRIGLTPWCFQDDSGRRELGMYLGGWNKYTVVSNAVAKALPYLRRAQKHGVPLTENYFKRLELMVRGYEHRDRKVALNAELSDAAQKGDSKLVESARARIAALEYEMNCDRQMLFKMDAEDQHAQEVARKVKVEAAVKREREERLCGAGVVKPFAPFNELERMSYEDCLAKAKENSAQAYYWLAYYFAEGKQVEMDQASAYKFLAKSSDMKYPQACYTMAQLHELWSLEDESGCNVRNDEVKRRFPVVGFRWDVPVFRDNRCLTNGVATSYVLNLYRDALKGGMLFATNDIARVEANIVGCKERIAKAEEAIRAKRDKAEKALSLLADCNSGSEASKAEPQKVGNTTEDDEIRERLANQAYWEGWPMRVDQSEAKFVAAVKAVEKQFKVALVDMTGAPKWMVGEGRSCIRYCANDGDYYEKYDAEGRLVKISGNRSDFAEMKAVDEKREELLKSEREAWAKAKGISYEDAMIRSNEWQNVGLIGGRLRLGGLQRPGGSGTGLLGGSLRARRLRRQQQEAAVAAAIREELAVKNAER